MSAEIDITAMARDRHTAADRRAPSMSPRPIALPTRVAAAPLMPSGTMNDSAARVSAI